MGYNTPKQTVSQFQLKGRYARQYLSFAGKSSKDFLLYLSGPGVYDSPAADVESTSVPGRNGDIMTYKEDVAVVKESFRGMLERGVYKEELFCDIK